MDTVEKAQWFDKNKTSKTGNGVARLLNLAGSIGFGYLIGPMLYGWTGLANGWGSLFGAITIGLAFDYMLIVWQSRTQTARSNTQFSYAEDMAEASLYSSTAASAIFVILQLAPWLPTITPFIDVIKGGLVALTVVVICAQMLYNVWYQMADPAILHDRVKAIEASNAQTQKLKRIGKQHKKKAQMVNKYLDLAMSKNAQQEAIEELREMGYEGEVDFSDFERSPDEQSHLPPSEDSDFLATSSQPEPIQNGHI